MKIYNFNSDIIGRIGEYLDPESFESIVIVLEPYIDRREMSKVYDERSIDHLTDSETDVTDILLTIINKHSNKINRTHISSIVRYAWNYQLLHLVNRLYEKNTRSAIHILNAAAEVGYVDVIKQFSNQLSNKQYFTSVGLQATIFSQPSVIKYIINEFPRHPIDKILTSAVTLNNIEIVKHLLSKQTTKSHNNDTTSLFRTAVKNNNVAIVKLLCSAFRNIDSDIINNVLIFHGPVRVRMLKALLDLGKNRDLKLRLSQSEYSAYFKPRSAIKMLIDYGLEYQEIVKIIDAAINNCDYDIITQIVDKRGSGILINCEPVYSSDMTMLRFLVGIGYELNDNVAYMIVWDAMIHDDLEMIKFIHEHSQVLINIPRLEHLVIDSINNNRIIALQYFLECCIDIDLNNVLSQTMYTINFDMAKLLVKHGVDIDTQNDMGHSLMRQAVGGNDCEMVEFLYKHGAKSESSMIELTVRKNRVEMAQLLKEKGIKFDQQHIDYAIDNQYWDLYDVLI